MSILSSDDIARIRSKYPSSTRKVSVRVHTKKSANGDTVKRRVYGQSVLEITRRDINLANEYLRVAKKRFVDTKVTKRSKRVTANKRNREVARHCYHWCPIGKHDWHHVIGDPGARLDEWEQPCQLHSRLKTNR